MGPIGRPETSVRNTHKSLRNKPEDRRSRSQGVLFTVLLPQHSR